MKERKITDAEMQALLDGRAPEEAIDGLAELLEAGDPEAALLAADLRTFVGAISGPLSESDRHAFEQTRELNLARLKRELRRREAAPPSRGLRRIAIVAALAAMLVLVVWLPRRDGAGPRPIVLADGSSYSMTTLAYSAPPQLRGAEANAAAWAEAGASYEASRFERAAGRFEAIADGDASSVDARLYAGVSALAAGDAARARRSLVEADRLAAEQALPRGATAYYLGLAELAAGDAAAARAALRRSAEAGGPFGERSRELLERL